MRGLEACPRLPQYLLWTAVLAVVGNKDGRFAKKICYFLRTDRYTECKVIITGKEVKLGDGEGMQVPCLLNIFGTKNMLQIIICKINRYRMILPFLPIIQPTI